MATWTSRAARRSALVSVADFFATFWRLIRQIVLDGLVIHPQYLRGLALA
jgi:hypothetical protein